MKKTEEKKGNIVRHIQSARQWLERAEHAVNSERPTRSELDLILAKAEVQLAQEKRSNAVELPSKIMTCVVQPRSMLTIAAGGMLFGLLIVFNAWSGIGQGANLPSVHSIPSKTQHEVPAVRELNTTLAIAPSSQERRENSEMPRGEQTDTFARPEPFTSVTNSNTGVEQATDAPSVVHQTVPVAVSEQEIRGLMRTAERALKDPK